MGQRVEGGEGSGGVSGRVKGERGYNQFASPISIMSSPVSIDLRIKLLRDLPELQSDQCTSSVGPDVTDMHHTVPQNTTDPSVTALQGTTHPCRPIPYVCSGTRSTGHCSVILSSCPTKMLTLIHNLNVPMGDRKTGSAYG